MIKSIVSIVFVLLCIVAVVIMAVFYNSIDYSKIPNDYAIVFDAGSSGSRMYIYQWRAGFSASKGDDLKVSERLSCKTDDNGLDKIKSKEEFIQKYSNCIKKAQDAIPDDRKSRAYLFLAATAGMRLLQVRNKTASDEIFGYVKDYFKTLDFLFKNMSQARIISGAEEGIDAWISANYYQNNFKPKSSLSGKAQPDTKGVLDMGGASTQIVYVPSEYDSAYKEFFTEIKIYGVLYKAYSHSFLCWGINQIGFLYQTLLLSKNNYPTTSAASCFPKNSNKPLAGSQILDSPCANGLVFNYKYNFTANSTRITPDTVYQFPGNSDHQNCENEVKILLPKIQCMYESCSFDGVYQPTLDNANFLGFSNFFYAISNTQKLFNKADDYDLPGFQQDTQFICSQTLDELKDLNNKNNAGLSDGFLINQCFLNTYSIQLLLSYGFKSFNDLKILEKVNGFSLNWALGYLVNELNRDDFLPHEEPPRKLKLSIFVTFTTILMFATLLILGITLYTKIKARYAKSNNEAIPFSRKRNNPADA